MACEVYVWTFAFLTVIIGAASVVVALYFGAWWYR